ncbi:hypothetical protein O3P69_000164 [Scylla paramamosain]|uniref:Uncharacterized protein n=1 Tax=Scylla paramamosain TaxID=85552 RepID=A0AAW0UV39_SCYPA
MRRSPPALDPSQLTLGSYQSFQRLHFATLLGEHLDVTRTSKPNQEVTPRDKRWVVRREAIPPPPPPQPPPPPHPAE